MADSDAASSPPQQEGADGGTRERWPSRFSFVMAAVGSAVGLGNVWRFPAVAYANGGGAFFIPYFVALLTAGIPLLILEFAIGQMMQGSAPKALGKLNKHFEWVGWFALLVGGVISTYYAVIMAWSWCYLWYSVSGMPWSAGGAGTEGDFFVNRFLQYSTEPGAMWGLRWPVVLGLALTWTAVFFIIYKGVRRVGKVVLYTVPIPWAIIMVLAVRGLTLEGASSGVEYYLRPDFSALARPSTWLAAYGQIFFSLTIGFGVMIAYASYRPRNSDVTNNAFITSFANCLTSFFAGFAVFSVLGFLAYKNGVPVSEVVKGGGGLAFITYPAAITKMGDMGWIWPPLIGSLFFFALLTLGIDSLFSLVEAIGAGAHDHFPRIKRVHLTAALCGGGFILGLLYCTRAGDAWITLFDHWANDYGLAIVGLLQCMLVSYFFSTHRVTDFANDVSEVKLSGWWELCVRVITPVVLAYLIASQLFGELASPSDAGYPAWMRWIALLVFVSLFAGALAITRRWSYIALAGIALVLGLVTYGVVRPASAAPEAKMALTEGGTYRADFRANFSGGEEAVATWDFGDGGSSDELNPSHTFAKAGTYKVTLAVRGDRGRGRAAKAELDVDARPFEVTKLDFRNARSRAGVKLPLAFKYSATAAFGTEPYAYSWDFGDGTGATGVEGTHVFEKPGKYRAKVKATDSSAAPREAIEETEVVASPFSVDLRVDHHGGETPAVVEFRATPCGSGGEALGVEGFTFEWDFGDGTTEDRATGARAAHRYDMPQELTSEGGGKSTQLELKAVVIVASAGGHAVSESVQIRLRPPEEHFAGRAALLSAIGGMLLIGGLALCVLTAMKHHRKGPPGFEEEAGG